MANQGCEVHAFDCTVPASDDLVRGRRFTFHQVCIGAETVTDLSTSKYAKDNAAKTKNAFTFKRMDTIQRELGHESVTVLKFDIEGGEWDLLEVSTDFVLSP